MSSQPNRITGGTVAASLVVMACLAAVLSLACKSEDSSPTGASFIPDGGGSAGSAPSTTTNPPTTSPDADSEDTAPSKPSGRIFKPSKGKLSARGTNDTGQAVTVALACYTPPGPAGRFIKGTFTNATVGAGKDYELDPVFEPLCDYQCDIWFDVKPGQRADDADAGPNYNEHEFIDDKFGGTVGASCKPPEPPCANPPCNPRDPCEGTCLELELQQRDEIVWLFLETCEGEARIDFGDDSGPYGAEDGESQEGIHHEYKRGDETKCFTITIEVLNDKGKVCRRETRRVCIPPKKFTCDDWEKTLSNEMTMDANQVCATWKIAGSNAPGNFGDTQSNSYEFPQGTTSEEFCYERKESGYTVTGTWRVKDDFLNYCQESLRKEVPPKEDECDVGALEAEVKQRNQRCENAGGTYKFVINEDECRIRDECIIPPPCDVEALEQEARQRKQRCDNAGGTYRFQINEDECKLRDECKIPPPECVPPDVQSFKVDRSLGNDDAECAFFGDYEPGTPGDFFVVKCGLFYQVTHSPFQGSTCSNGQDVSHSTACICVVDDNSSD